MNIHLFFKNLPMFRFFSQTYNINLIVYLHTESTKTGSNYLHSPSASSKARLIFTLWSSKFYISFHFATFKFFKFIH